MNDILENRIEKNLKILSRSILVHLPDDESVTLDDFVTMQEKAVRDTTEQLMVSRPPWNIWFLKTHTTVH